MVTTLPSCREGKPKCVLGTDKLSKRRELTDENGGFEEEGRPNMRRKTYEDLDSFSDCIERSCRRGSVSAWAFTTWWR